MYSTSRLGLPLVMPAQAQKHVTVNEAFARLDAAVQLRFSASTLESPPPAAAEGECFLVPPGATGEWKDASGNVAVRSNGGWIYLPPSAGWIGWDTESARRLVFDGFVWSAEPQAVSRGGAATFSDVIEFDHDIVPGPYNMTSVMIPAYSQVIGITGRVKSPIEGVALTNWRVGVEGSDDRYGAGIGLSSNSYFVGISGHPVTYYSDTSLKISSAGGEFTGGSVRFCIHRLSVRPPASF